jgi:hypothetical protein
MAKKKSAKKRVARSTKRAPKLGRTSAKAMKAASVGRPGKVAGRMGRKKATKSAVAKLSRKLGKKPTPVPAGPTEARSRERLNEPELDLGFTPGFDAKAKQTREYMKKMEGVELQRVEERHKMTRHKRNQSCQPGFVT